MRKKATYAMAGVREYWVVDAGNRTGTILTLVDGQYQVLESPDGILRSGVVPGFQVSLTDVFAGVQDED